MYSVVFSLIEFILKDRIQPILTFLPVKPVYLSNLNQIIPPLRSYIWNTFHSFLGWSLLSNSTLFDFTHNMRAQIISPVSLNHEPRKTCWRLQIFSTKLKLVSFYGIQETFGNIWLTGRGVLFSVKPGLNTLLTTLCYICLHLIQNRL